VTHLRKQRSAAWRKDEPAGAEFATVRFNAEALHATGVAIGSHPEPYRLDYALKTTREYQTSHVCVRAAGDGWHRKLELHRRGAEWSAQTDEHGSPNMPAPGGDVASLSDAVDPDLGLSPLFNSMPVLRHNLHITGSSMNFLMLWISVPDLSVHPSRQRYTHLGRRAGINLVRFEAIGEDDGFTAVVQFDDDGLVLDYPGIARRL
jgi:uncharacterized protein